MRDETVSRTDELLSSDDLFQDGRAEPDRGS